jgi:transposase
MSESEWTKILGWPGYRVYRSEINEEAKTVRLWVRRKRGNRKLECSGCGRRIHEIAEVYEREVRDLPCFEYRTTVVIELYRLRCPECGIKAEKVALLPSKAPHRREMLLFGGVDEFATLQSGECLDGPSCLFLGEP